MVRNCEVSPFVLRHVFHWRRGTARQWRRLQDYGTNGRRDQREREAPGHRRDRGCDGESATVASCRFVERGSIHQTFIQTKSNVVLRRRRTKYALSEPPPAVRPQTSAGTAPRRYRRHSKQGTTCRCLLFRVICSIFTMFSMKLALPYIPL